MKKIFCLSASVYVASPVVSLTSAFYRHFDDEERGGEICISLHRMRFLSRASFEMTIYIHKYKCATQQKHHIYTAAGLIKILLFTLPDL